MKMVLRSERRSNERSESNTGLAYTTEADFLMQERTAVPPSPPGPGIIGPRSCDDYKLGAPRGCSLFPHTFLPNSCRVP